MNYSNLRTKIEKKLAGGALAAIGTAAELGLSFIPGISEAIDVAGIISGLATGNLGSAALSAIGLILPGVGGGALKAGRKASKVVAEGVGKKAVEKFGLEGAEKIGKRILSKGINPKAQRTLTKIFGVNEKELLVIAKDMVKESEAAFSKIHGYDKKKIIEEMEALYLHRDTERRVFQRAAKNATEDTYDTVAAGIRLKLKRGEIKKVLAEKALKEAEESGLRHGLSDNEEYLDMWYKLQNGEVEWPIFVKGKPSAREIVEAALSDAKEGRATYISAVKGSGDLPGRTEFRTHSVHDFGKMLFTGTEKNTGLNYTYSALGIDPYRLPAGNMRTTMIHEREQILELITKELREEGLSKTEIDRIINGVHEKGLDTDGLLDIFRKILEVYDRENIKLGTTLKGIAKWTGKGGTKPKHYEQIPEEVLLDTEGHSTAVAKELQLLESQLTNILENKGMSAGVTRSGIIRVEPEAKVALVNWKGQMYDSGKHVIPEMKESTSYVLEMLKSGDKDKVEKAKKLLQGIFTKSDDVVGTMHRKHTDIGIIDEIRDPNIVGTDIVVGDPRAFRISRKQGGSLNYFNYLQ